MAVARHGTGYGSALGALASQIHPVFMLPPVAVSLFGAFLAGEFSLHAAALHAIAIGAAVYVAHVKDGLVDFHRRGEDDDHPLTRRGCFLALAAGSLVFLTTLVLLGTIAGWLPALLTAPTWAIGFLHAPQLDTNPITATIGYPAGIVLALVGAYAVQTGGVTAIPLAYGLVLFVLLTGVKIVDDLQDRRWDRSFGKRSLPVVIGPARARYLGNALLAAGAVMMLGFIAIGWFPDGVAVGVFVFGAVAAVAAERGPERATMLLVRGAYLLLACMVLAVWYRPLAGVPPRLSFLGPYVYLAVETAFGLVGLSLLYATGTLRRAARTIAILYPIAFVWDWYSLQIGIFEITRRTGIEVAGIPLEEHLFIVVVPAFILGLHGLLES
ncbi:MAG: UbiA family prenyltransferase [Halodesulfurarchaeum sp.]